MKPLNMYYLDVLDSIKDSHQAENQQDAMEILRDKGGRVELSLVDCAVAGNIIDAGIWYQGLDDKSRIKLGKAQDESDPVIALKVMYKSRGLHILFDHATEHFKSPGN